MVTEMKQGDTSNARIAAANAILDRGWGKPRQLLHAEVRDKRSLHDWSDDELLEIIERSKAGNDQDCSDPEEDSGDPAKSEEVTH